jgi:hypothetical protein
MVSGIGHGGLCKLFSVLNIAPPTNEDYFTEMIRHTLPVLETFKIQSMKRAVQETVIKQGSKDLVVSGDGSWQRRGFSSTHGVAAVLSSNDAPKVLDIQRLSKRCSICQGIRSMRLVNSEKFERVMMTHKCQKNFEGSSGEISIIS